MNSKKVVFSSQLCVAVAMVMALLLPSTARSQTAYFIDGYHGGIWGHFPDWNTKFMADQLLSHPKWKINLELEPETWDDAKKKDSSAYNEFKNLFTADSTKDRIEYVNPDYA